MERAGAIEVEVERKRHSGGCRQMMAREEVRRKCMLATLGCSRLAGAAAFLGKPPGSSQIWY